MNIMALLYKLPLWKTAKWLLAEAGWQRDVATWLAAENAFYFKLAAAAWATLEVKDPDALKAELMKEWLAGTISLAAT